MSIFNRIETDYTKRVHLEPEREMVIYISLIGFCAVLFLAFGARNHLNNYLANRSYEKELAQILEVKRRKLRESSTLIEVYNKNKVAIEQFDRYMPSDLSEQDFLVDFVTQEANQGYIVDTWNVLADRTNHTATIQTTLTGTWEGTVNLVKSIENQKRLSTINIIEITPEEDGLIEVNLELKIYYKPL